MVPISGIVIADALHSAAAYEPAVNLFDGYSWSCIASTKKKKLLIEYNNEQPVYSDCSLPFLPQLTAAFQLSLGHKPLFR